MTQSTVLFRESLGDVLRGERVRQELTLRELSSDARVSLGYISEVERGQKEASSELLAALCEALGVPLSQVLREVSVQVAEGENAAFCAQSSLAPLNAPHAAPTGLSTTGPADVRHEDEVASAA